MSDVITCFCNSTKYELTRFQELESEGAFHLAVFVFSLEYHYKISRSLECPEKQSILSASLPNQLILI